MINVSEMTYIRSKIKLLYFSNDTKIRHSIQSLQEDVKTERGRSLLSSDCEVYVSCNLLNFNIVFISTLKVNELCDNRFLFQVAMKRQTKILSTSEINSLIHWKGFQHLSFKRDNVLFQFFIWLLSSINRPVGHFSNWSISFLISVKRGLE